jgi:hypothetical protein
MNTDLVVGVSDQATDSLYVLFNTEIGRELLQERHKVSEETIKHLSSFGFSGIANVLAAIKTAKHLRLGADDVIVTVATDGAAMYGTEKTKAITKHFGYGFDMISAAETYGRFMLGVGTDDLLELDQPTRERIFNLGYFTWVEQQGVALSDFDARKKQSFWRDLRPLVGAWDTMIDEFNARVRG